ncbi:hypothetical protein ACZ90_28315 [Streptomyces albus subsp. albus]|nr:hypothetical protein ACZ90_28315 [Streptomyces albus subsp. albus]
MQRERALPTGPVFRCGGARGASEVSRVRLDLRRPQRAAVEYDDGDKPVGQYPTARYQVAAQGDPAYFDIEITGGQVAYDFVLELSYLQGGQRHRLVIDDGGRMLTLAPPVSPLAHGYRCDFDTDQWIA